MALLMTLASTADAAMVIDLRYQELWARLSTQRFFATYPSGGFRTGGNDDALDVVQTNERNQLASAGADRSTLVAADSIFLTGSTQALATHGEPLAGSDLCWCRAESWVRNLSEFSFTVDERSSFSLSWILTDLVMPPGPTTRSP